MAFAFKTGFVWYCLYLVVCISGNTVTASFEIRRGKSDTFANLECQKSNNCTDEQCAMYAGAKCVGDKCERCQCKVGSATFLANSITATANCTKDENIIPESGMNDIFTHITINVHGAYRQRSLAFLSDHTNSDVICFDI
jgi:hypothetical protein